MKITITEEMRACLRMIREADEQGDKLSRDFPAFFACYAARATGAIDLARLVAAAVERAEKDTAPAGRPGDCAACPHPGSEHLAFSGLCTADGCPCIEHEPKGGRDA